MGTEAVNVEDPIVIVTEHIDVRCLELLPFYAGRVSARVARGSFISNLQWSWYSGVYFVLIAGFIKVGYAYDVRARLKTYDTSSPFTPVPLGFIQRASESDALALEHAIVEAFVGYRIKRREWFRDDQAIRAYIEARAGRWPAPTRKTAQ